MPSTFRAWCYLILLSTQRQARARQMVWIALGLLALITTIAGIRTAAGWWGIENLRDRELGRTYREWQEALEVCNVNAPWPNGNNVIMSALVEAAEATFKRAAFY